MPAPLSIIHSFPLCKFPTIMQISSPSLAAVQERYVFKQKDRVTVLNVTHSTGRFIVKGKKRKRDVTNIYMWSLSREKEVTPLENHVNWQGKTLLNAERDDLNQRVKFRVKLVKFGRWTGTCLIYWNVSNDLLSNVTSRHFCRFEVNFSRYWFCNSINR